MEKQLAAIDFQAMELRKLRDEKLSAILVQQQTEQLKDWANQYLANVAEGLRVLEMDLDELSDSELFDLYSALGAARFEEKYDGDKFAALKWSILEEKRRTVRMLISQVLLVKDENGGKRIIPQLAFELPSEFVSLVYDYQSLAYVEKARELIRDE